MSRAQRSTGDEPEEIFAFDPFAFGLAFDPFAPTPADAGGIALADEHDPKLLTDAGRLFDLHAWVLERAYVGEEMARLVWTARFDEMLVDERDPFLRHQGAAELLDGISRSLFKASWRGSARLDRIAARVLLGRAKTRLRPLRSAAAPYEGAGNTNGAAEIILAAARRALGRP